MSQMHRRRADKLKLNGGDMKSVQDDSGHAQVKMAALLKSLAKNL